MIPVLILCMIVLAQCSPCHASVLINEFSTQSPQTVEIINSSSVSADISGWHIDDSGGTTYITLDHDTIIPPYSCHVFTGSFNFNSTSSDMIRLFDSSYPPTTAAAHLVDQFEYVKAPSSYFSLGRFPDGSSTWQELPQSFGYLNETGQICLAPSTTPIPTPLPTQTPTAPPHPTQDISPTQTEKADYDGLSIAEVYPCPQHDTKETVVIYNGNDFSVQLSQWYIDDAENAGSSPKPFDAVLSPHASVTIELASAMLNNTGDTVRLLNADLQEKDSFEYVQCNNRTPSEEPISIQLMNSISPTQKPSKPIVQKSIQKSVSKKLQSPLIEQQITAPSPEVLGALSIVVESKTKKSPHHIFLFVPLSYSFLTIASLFIKMNHA